MTNWIKNLSTPVIEQILETAFLWFVVVDRDAKIIYINKEYCNFLEVKREDAIGKHVAEIIEKAPLRKIWLAADQKAPLAWNRTNASLANAISNGALQARIEAKLAELEGKPKAILLITDLEALHPYTRIGVIEGKLQSKFRVPTVFFYPGVRTGKTRLKFLGFYPDDGNYRSVHVGG